MEQAMTTVRVYRPALTEEQCNRALNLLGQVPYVQVHDIIAAIMAAAAPAVAPPAKAEADKEAA